MTKEISKSEKKSRTSKQSSKKKKWNTKPILILMILILIIATLYVVKTIFLFHGIETPLRICIALLLIDFTVIFSLVNYKIHHKGKIKAVIFMTIFSLVYAGSIFLVSNEVQGMYSELENIQNETITYSTDVVVRSSSKIEKIGDIKGKKIGMVKIATDAESEDKTELSDIPNQILEEQKISSGITKYDSPQKLIDALLDGKVEVIFLPTGYTDLYEDNYPDLAKDTKSIHTETLKETVKIEQTVQKSLDEPFTMLIMGLDKSHGGGDSLLLITFNPNTLNSTILSIPRDSYIPITCNGNQKEKVTNATSSLYREKGDSDGTKCLMQSIENYFKIKIDYYYKINFDGVVDLVDAVDGIDVDIPYAFCEQNSNSQWGKKTVFVDAGKQHLNGEQALAFARHRKVTAYQRNYCGSKYVQNAGYWNDFTRGQSQQAVLKATLSKIADKATSPSDIKSLLKVIGENAATNMSTNTILDLYNLGKNILSNANSKDQLLNMQRLYLAGYDAYIRYPGYQNSYYTFVIYDKSFEDVTNAMKENLGLKQSTVVKSFQFSIGTKYEPTVIGKNSYSNKTLVLMPNFQGKDISVASAFAQQHGLTIIQKGATGTSQNFIGQILNQSIPSDVDIDTIKNKSITLTVVTSIPSYVPPTTTEPEEPTPEDPGNSETTNSNTNPETPENPDDSTSENTTNPE